MEAIRAKMLTGVGPNARRSCSFNAGTFSGNETCQTKSSKLTNSILKASRVNGFPDRPTRSRRGATNERSRTCPCESTCPSLCNLQLRPSVCLSVCRAAALPVSLSLSLCPCFFLSLSLPISFFCFLSPSFYLSFSFSRSLSRWLSISLPVSASLTFSPSLQQLAVSEASFIYFRIVWIDLARACYLTAQATHQCRENPVKKHADVLQPGGCS